MIWRGLVKNGSLVPEAGAPWISRPLTHIWLASIVLTRTMHRPRSVPSPVQIFSAPRIASQRTQPNDETTPRCGGPSHEP